MKIHLEKYSSDWQREYALLENEIQNLLANFEVRIAHIGSTSVFGMAAKPIIDILVGIKYEALLNCAIEPFIKAGYIYIENYNAI
ncbi:GrpB family protein [Dyadobacter sp. CY327]|uniref:GrpB family protein n=1 Tax=Dyadobacter sp. CY327 TaxID=2907301 RepID=UPI0021036FB8|nr:GrpB family protein [Dyadobacter sp. CY327]